MSILHSREMLLAVDIGNSFTKFGFFEGETLTSKFSIPTKRDSGPGDIRQSVGDKLHGTVETVVVCSVVCAIDDAMSRYLQSAAGVEPIFVNNTFDFGLEINYHPLDTLGTDRLVAAFAAAEGYGAPCIICSLGTATTIDALGQDREFLGGIIAPGMEAMAEALHLKAPRLPQVDVSKPATLLGNSTEASIQSGIYNGYFAMVRGLIAEFKDVLGPDSKVIATGGNSRLVADDCRAIDIVEPDLVLTGLNLIGRS